MSNFSMLQTSALDIVFKYHVTDIGEFCIRPLDLVNDSTLLHGWVSAERARFWGMQDYSEEDVRRVYQEQLDSPHCQPYIGLHNGIPSFLLETYDPAHDLLASHYEVAVGDVGMHFLIGPSSGLVMHGFSRAVMQTIMAFLFSNPAHLRVVVEPDITNEKIHPINTAAGFCYTSQITLPHKTAWLAFCQRKHFFQTLNAEVTT